MAHLLAGVIIKSHLLCTDIYNAYGPNGSDEIMVFFVEGDGSTNTADLNGTGNNDTLGDWITGTPYPVIDDASIASSYQIGYFPTIFRVCPDGLVYEEGQSSVNQLVFQDKFKLLSINSRSFRSWKNQ